MKQRVKNHFPPAQTLQSKNYGGQGQHFKDSIFLPQTNQVGYIETNSEIEALLLETNLIKQYKPKYNTVWRDGKSHNFVYITKEDFPRVFISHQKAKS
ncbi:hypothetical protein L6252_02810 [Candidatus Parcubacteria bacterium]|nr:hypothetical protein [Candidatus Parcubacteria bacterium]